MPKCGLQLGLGLTDLLHVGFFSLGLPGKGKSVLFPTLGSGSRAYPGTGLQDTARHPFQVLSRA